MQPPASADPHVVTVCCAVARAARSLTMSLLCCFSLRDYGSKRKSGKSNIFLHCSSLKLTLTFLLCHLLLLEIPIGGWGCVLCHKQDCGLSAAHVMSVCGVFASPALGFGLGSNSCQAVSFWLQIRLTAQGGVQNYLVAFWDVRIKLSEI